MAARAKDVETGRKGGASSSSSDSFSSPAQKAKGNPRAPHSSVAGSSPDRGATTGRHVPHYLRPTISSYHGRAATDPQLAKATRQPAHPKSPSPSPSSSSSKSTSTRRKSYSTSTSPKEGSSKASNVPFSKSAVFSRSASTKLLKPHERGSSTTTASSAAAKQVATKKSKGSVTSDLRKAVTKANKDAAPTRGGQDRAEEKTMIVQEPEGTHIGKDLKNSVASDSLHVSSDQLTQTAAAATVNIAADDSNDPADLKMPALSKEPQAGVGTFPPKNPPSNIELNAEDTHIEESRDKAKILDVVQTKEGFDADASAINGDYDSGDLKENAEEEEGEANREQAEAEDCSCIDPTDSLNRKQDGAKETADGERVAEPSTPNNGTPNSREGKEFCRASVLSPTTEDGENKPRKLEFRRGTTISPKIEDDANTPRKLEFRKGTVLPRKPEEEENTPRKLEFRRGRAADKDNEQGGSQEKDGAVVYNQVIEETASKLVGARRSKVRALVGAFETVISIHETDAQSSQSHAPAPSASASDPASPAGPLQPSGSTPPPASHVLDPLPDSASIPPPSPNSALNLDEDPAAPTAQGQEEEDKADGKEDEEEHDDDDEKEEEKEKEDEDEEKAASHHD